jgi:hypothetical protein
MILTGITKVEAVDKLVMKKNAFFIPQLFTV